MNANDVYNVAKALPNEELKKLCIMLKADSVLVPRKRVKKTKSIDFTVEDGIEYLITKYFNKVRKS